MLITEPTDMPRFEVLSATGSDELAERRRRRSKAALDRNAQIAAYWRKECQGMTQRQAAAKIAAQFGGEAATHQPKISRVYSKINA
jgi:hypothetical protein